MSHFSQGHALIIGVGADLPGTVEDARGLAGLLTDEGRCAYPPAQVTVLTAALARREAILAALDDLAARTSPEDTAIVYFSGHGYRIASPFGAMHYLLPYGYDIARLPATAISGLELAQKLAAIPAGKLLVLLDCCHAGGLDNIKTPGAEFTREALPPEALTLLSQGRGQVVIASSRANEISLAGKPYSAFTLALMEALCGVEASTQDGYVRVADLAMYASNAVTRRTGDRQHPILNYKEADNFVVAYYAGGDEIPKGVPYDLAAVSIEVEPGHAVPIHFVRTEGGAYFEQGTQIQVGGNFAGRDMQIHHHHYPAPPVDPLALKLDDLERRYLQGLYAESNALPLAGDAPPDALHRRQPRLQQIYVDLATTRDPTFEQICDRLDFTPGTRRALSSRLRRNFRGEGSAGRANQPTAQDLGMWLASMGGLEDEEREKLEEELGVTLMDLSDVAGPLSAYEAIGQHTQLVLLGDPGSGKSTLTRRMAGVLAAVSMRDLPKDEQDWSAQLDDAFDRWLLPVRVVLSSWANHLTEESQGVADDLIAECMRILAQTGKLQDADLQKRFLARLSAEQPTVLLLLDGLDEVADVEKRKRLLAALRDFCDHYTDVPLVVTCRVRPYTEGEHYRLSLPDFEIGPLPQPAIHAFVERWHRELTWAGFYTPETAAESQARLLAAIDDPHRQDLREMAATPLLLTMMARLNHSRGLPEGRAELYEEYLKQLLYEWERTKHEEGVRATQLDSLLTEGRVNRASLDRALNGLAYTVHGQDGSRDTVEIPRSALRDAFERIHPGDEAEKAAWAVRLLRLIDDRSGLIYAVEQGSLYRFSHRTFQEYLAARWLATGNFVSKFRDKLDHEQWREAIFLALGYQISVRSEYDNALAVFDELLPPEPNNEAAWRQVLLLGEAYVHLLGPQRAGEAEQKNRAERVMRAIPDRLTSAMQNRDLPPRQRLDAGLLLADLHSLPPDLDDFVPIAAAAELGYDFRMGKYPVTNTQFIRFFVEDGYAEDKPWWTEAAVKDIERYYKDWRKGPRYWGDPGFDRATQPVVGVSWYEAVAYCEWLTEKLRAAGEISRDEIVRLPTEEEWMRAALGPHPQTKGEKRDGYPWGDDFDPALANTKESNLGQATPVHMYPHGKSPEGVWDLAGNVWEWLQAPRARVKGGSWFWEAERAKVSARDLRFLSGGDDDLGFRCVVVPISRA